MIRSLEDFKAHNKAVELGEEIWKVVCEWDYFSKDTVGKQFIKAADSIAANLSEGLGRYHFKEIGNFTYYSRGSLFETRTWTMKAYARGLIKKEKFDTITSELEILGKMINAYINSVGEANEPEVEYLPRNPKSQASSPKT